MISNGHVKQHLLKKIEKKEARIAIIGLGYVGLPLATVFGDAGFEVIGLDLDEKKVVQINAGHSYIEDVDQAHLAGLVKKGKIRASTNFAELRDCDAVSICVPTPLSKTRDPDMSYIVEASNRIAEYLHPGLLIVLESTTYPGTTTEVVLPAMEEAAGGFKVGQDFFLCFSPERVDPGREDWTTQNTPKVIGGVTPECLEVGMALYGSAMETMVPVSSTEAAELTKILENTFRSVNIGLVNEVLLMCDKLGLDAWEVIDAAATKPFGFMKFTPGPGLGGHCIPIDPLYLSWKLRMMNYNARFIEMASEINTGMPAYWVNKVQDALNEAAKPVRGSKVLVMGVAYKKDISDLRESPALDIILLLQGKGADVQYYDPHVPFFSHDGHSMTCAPDCDDAIREADCVVIATDHSAFDWDKLAREARLIVDARGVMRKLSARVPA